MRDEGLDAACGFCLCIVILGHAICMCPTEINLYVVVDLCCFYLAFFFFKAGVVFRHKPNRDVLNGGLRRLLYPYVLWCVVGTVVLILIDYCNYNSLIVSAKREIVRAIFDTKKMGAPSGNLALWFLPSLFVCRCLMNVLTGYISKWLLLVISLTIPVIMQLVSGGEYYNNMPFYLKNIPIGLSLMLFGYVFKNLRNEKILILSAILYFLIYLLYPSHLGIMGGEARMGTIVSGMMADFMGCMMIYNLFSSLTLRGLNSVTGGVFMRHLGRHSMPYYCQHWIILLVVGNLLQGVNEYVRVIVMLISCILIMPITYHLMKKCRLAIFVGE